MSRFKTVLVALFSALAMVWGYQDSSAAQTKWQGYVIDRQCAESVRGDTDPVPFLRRHSKDCSLMPSCQRDGYSLYASGKWLDLDRSGNKIIIQTIKSSKKKSGFYAEVAGTEKGKTLKVERIKEIEEPAPTKAGEEK